MIKFSTDENLGKVVDIKATKVWCFGVDPITSLYDLRFAGGGNKFSQLCAFKFKSINPAQTNPYFSIAFVAKLRSKFYRDYSRNPSEWYIFKQINRTQTDVLDKNSCFINYGFDVMKFFESDLFHIMLPKLKAAIKKGLSEIPAFIDTLQSDTDKNEAMKFSDSIAAGLDQLSIARVNDKYYSLKVGGLAEESVDLDEKIEQEFKRRGIYADLGEPLLP